MLRRTLQVAWNAFPLRDMLHYYLLQDTDKRGLVEVCDIFNWYCKVEHLQAVSHAHVTLLPKKKPDGIMVDDWLFTNLVLVRKVVGMGVKEVEQPWLRHNGSTHPKVLGKFIENDTSSKIFKRL